MLRCRRSILRVCLRKRRCGEPCMGQPRRLEQARDPAAGIACSVSMRMAPCEGAPDTWRLAPAVGEVRADAEMDRHPLYLARRAAALRAPLCRCGITAAARRLPARAYAKLSRLPRPSRRARASRRGGT